MADYGFGPASGGILFTTTPYVEWERAVIRKYRARFTLLTPRQRQICLLFVGTHHRHPIIKAAIARILGCSKNAVGNQIKDAIITLRDGAYYA